MGSRKTRKQRQNGNKKEFPALTEARSWRVLESRRRKPAAASVARKELSEAQCPRVDRKKRLLKV